MKKYICVIHIILLINLSSLSVSENREPDEAPFLVRTKGNLLTVKARDIPLEEVLTEIANQTRINFVLCEPAEESISADFSNLPLEKGLKRLTRDFDHVLVYGPNTAKRVHLKIKTMLIFPREGGRSKKGSEARVIVPEKRTLRALGNASMDSLIKALGDKDPEVREDAVDSLAEFEDEKVIMHLTKVLLNDKDEDVRANAADVLGELGGENARDALIQALQDEDAGVRESAVDALAEIGGQEVVPPLTVVLRDEVDDVRESAADALEEITEEKYSY